MISDIDNLLYNFTQLDKRTSANNIINTFGLPLTQNNILVAFYTIRHVNDMFYADFYDIEQCFLCLSELLIDNTNMFIAVIYAFLCAANKYNLNHQRNILNLTLNRYRAKKKLGLYKMPISDIVDTYKALLNYYDFVIDDLAILDECKLELIKYRNKKYGGELTKTIANTN